MYPSAEEPLAASRTDAEVESGAAEVLPRSAARARAAPRGDRRASRMAEPTVMALVEAADWLDTKAEQGSEKMELAKWSREG